MSGEGAGVPIPARGADLEREEAGAPLPAPEPEPEPQGPREAAQVERLLGAVRALFSERPTLRIEVAPFLEGATWRLEHGRAVGQLGARWCRVTAGQVEIGHDQWPGSKRIPL